MFGLQRYLKVNLLQLKQNESDKISNSLLSKLIINLSKLLGAV